MLLNALIKIKENRTECIAQEIREMLQENGLECTVEQYEIVESQDRQDNKLLKLFRKKYLCVFAEDPNNTHNIRATISVKALSKKKHNKNDNVWHIKYGMKLTVPIKKLSRREAEREIQRLISHYRYTIPIQNNVELTVTQEDISVNVNKHVRKCYNMTTKELIATIKDLQTQRTL